MTMTRKEFLQAAAGSIVGSAIARTALSDTEKPGPKRGVSVYSYVSDLNITCTLEDCFAEINDLDTRNYDLGLEVLTGVVEDYPNPSDAWVKKWQDMCAKYHVKPVEFGHWIDSKLYNEAGPYLSTRESCEQLVQDIKVGSKLGFTHGRTKLGVIDQPGMPEFDTLTPVRNWREIIKMALPVAEKYNFRMLPEIHAPTLLKSKILDDYVDFIQKEKTTPWFGLNIDFGVFQNITNARGRGGQPGGQPMKEGAYSKPEEIIPLLPYVHCCHAKFNEINDNCECPNIPYAAVIEILKKHNWNGYLLSEYEGADRDSGGGFAAVRKQHVLMKRLLGEA
jgi:sugar phosphate isomerase/epimerase